MTLRLGLAFILGAWLAGTLFMWLVAMKNFETATAILTEDRPELASVTPHDLRAALRYQASEVNRLFFAGWGWAQVALGALATFSSWRRGLGRIIPAICVGCWVVTLVLQLYIVPETILVGRQIDFAELPQAEARFWTLHHAYTGLDMAKFLSLITASSLLLVRAARSSAAGSR